MPRVALNGRFTGTPQPTGTQVASFQLFNAILREPGDAEFVVFADRRFPGAADWSGLRRVTFVQTPFQDWSRAAAQLWEQVCAPALAARHGCGIMHHPMTTCPAWQNGIRNIVTLHDWNFHLHPEWFSRSFRLVYRLFAVPGLRRCRSIVTISEYVRGQTAEILGLPAQRIGMIYNGVKPMQAVAPRPGHYLFAAGSLQPHKNLVRLIRAFRAVRETFPDLELLVAGRPQARFTSDPDLAGLLSSPGVQLAGYLSDEELANAYAGARAFCFPSLEEGFGLPLLEAMTLGCPVLTSNVSCLPEIAGPAIQVDPRSEEAMAAGIQRILNLTAEERGRLVAEGREWASRFSWQSSARAYLKLYQEVGG